MFMNAAEMNWHGRLGPVIKLVLLIAIMCLLPTPARAGLVYSVPPIQGTITDATTGQPIDNAVLEVQWIKTVYGFFHPQSIVMKKMYVVTDETGVFRIPAYSSVHIFSQFTSVIWVVRHPLHSTDQLGIGREELDALQRGGNTPDKGQAKVLGCASLGASGEVIFDFSLLSLKEKFKEKPRVEDSHGALDSEFLFEGPKYFRAARELGLDVDTNAILQEWDGIASRFRDAEFIQSALQLGKEKIAAEVAEGLRQ